MKQITLHDTIDLNGRTLAVNASLEKKQGCFVEILKAIDAQLNAMLSYHSRVMILRLDLHTSDYSENNSLVSNFMRKIKKQLSKKYGLKRIGSAWVREIERVKKQHYHIALIFDASTIRHPRNVIALCEQVWQAMSQPKPFTPPHCYYCLSRSDTQGYSVAFHRLSYMAKLRGKGKKGKTANDYSTSRIVPKSEVKK